MRTLILIFAASLLATPALGRGRRRSRMNAEDPSTNFSQHFDDEVKYERDHPQSDGGTPAPKKHRRRHKKAPPSGDDLDTTDSF